MKILRLLAAIMICMCAALSVQKSAATPIVKTKNHRTIVPLSQGWKFLKDPANHAVLPKSSLAWRSVNLPHTWNDRDVEDNIPGYYRGAGWYKKTITASASWKGKQVYLCFNGANQETEVYVNGKKAGEHAGGYTRFLIPLAGLLNFNGTGENVIAVKVNNRYNANIAPLSADFTFFGGIYRNVSLLVLNPVHFNDDNYGADGLYISTPEVSAAKASLKISGQVVNKSAETMSIALRNFIRDPQGKVVSVNTFPLGNAAAGKRISFSHKLPQLSKPQLWSPEQPALYTVTTDIIDAKTGAIIDQVQQKTGLRWFRFDPKTGFFLNGKPYKLMGASRHQDYKGLGNAVPTELQVKDVQLLKATGANFLRVAHYPQDQAVLNACDELGILASVEIPIVSEITESAAFTNNAIRMQLEMIFQNYNHPSIVIWAYMNEILLKTKFKDNEARRATYLENVRRLALALDKVTRRVDPSRYTMMSNHSNIAQYQKAGLTSIPMVVGWNLYSGWYGGKVTDIGNVLDRIHKEMPNTPFMVTEYGADADPRIHADQPERFDKSVEYAVKYHQTYLNAILKRPFVAGAQAWNFADFSSEDREETMAHINNKGLMTHDRKPKNTYFLYKAYLSPAAYLKIGTTNGETRVGQGARGENVAKQHVDVFGNVKQAELFINGKSVGIKMLKDRAAGWEVPFHNGQNVIKVVALDGPKLEDQAQVNFKIIPENLKNKALPFKHLAISLGDPRYYVDDLSGKVWLPDQPYRKGSWGYIGGEMYKMEQHVRQPFGTDKTILNTLANPLYQTQRIGLKAYRLDVPDGKYEITMHFAELVGSEMTTVLPYNLLARYKKPTTEDRVFNIYLDKVKIATALNLPKRFGPAMAVSKKTVAIVRNDQGIRLEFEAIAGRPVLNALEVNRLE
jgi:beta-galactosidase